MEDYLNRSKLMIEDELKKMTEKDKNSKMRFYMEKDWVKFLKMFYFTYLQPNSYQLLVINPKKQLRSYEIKSAMGLDQNAALPMQIITLLLREFIGISS